MVKFIFWELNFYKSVGYDIEFKDYVNKEIESNGNEIYYVKSSKKFVPNFLINKNDKISDINDILYAFNLVGDFLEKTILRTIGASYPNSRIDFYSSIKNLSQFDQQNTKQ